MADLNVTQYDTKLEVPGAEQPSDVLDRDYYRGLPAVLKGAQVLLSLLAYIIMEATSAGPCQNFAPTYGFFKFVSMVAFVSSLIIWAMLLMRIPQRLCTCSFCNWPFIRLVFLAVLVLVYLIINIVLAAQACDIPGRKAACAFGFLALGTFIVDLALAFKQWFTIRREGAAEDNNPPRY